MRGVEQIPFLYDALMAVGELFGLRRWRRWLASGATGRTLEVGCGTGRNLALYAPGAQVVAFDPDLAVLRRARDRAPRMLLIRASAEALPFRDAAFDTVVSGLVFCSVPDPLRGLGEVRRVLRPQGSLRMIEHVRAPDGSLSGWFQDRIQPLWTWLLGGCHNNRRTERNVESAGFRIDADTRGANGTLRRFVARPTRG